MLARGKKFNREFAFISFETEEQAAAAVDHLDGTNNAKLEKDERGVTVEFESTRAAAKAAATTPATAASPASAATAAAGSDSTAAPRAASIDDAVPASPLSNGAAVCADVGGCGGS